MTTDLGLREETGMSMVEIVISMFLVGLLSIGLLPLLLTVTKHTATNRDVFEATQFARAKVTEVQALAPSDPAAATRCTTISARLSGAGTIDPSTGFHYSYTPASCPAASAYPTTLPVTITVKNSDQSKTLSTLTTKVRVSERG